MSKSIEKADFNQMVSSMLVMYSKYLQIPENEIMLKIIGFNNQLDNQIKQINKSITTNEKSVQL